MCDTNLRIGSRTGPVLLMLALVLAVIATRLDATENTKRARAGEANGVPVPVEDSEPPEIQCPPDVSFSCDEIGDFGTAVATDDWDPAPVLDYTDEMVFIRCPYEYTILRTWTATDESGNTSSCKQTIAIIDTVPPVFLYCPPDTLVACEDVVASLAHAVAADNCNPEVDVRYEATKVPGSCPNEFRILRSWEATDRCCNRVACQQVVSVRDTKPPVLDVAPDDTLRCNEPAVFGEPAISDNCDENPLVTVVSTVVEPGPGPCQETHTRCWAAQDGCGNASDLACQTIVTLTDTVPPELSSGFNHRVPYGDPIAFTPPQVTDNCDSIPLIMTTGTTILTGPAPGETTFTTCWMAADACGNSSGETCQSIIMEACPFPFCTFRCWNWAAACLEGQNRDISTSPACIRDEHFYDVFPDGVRIGSSSGHTALWTSPQAIEEFECSYGIPKALGRDFVNPERYQLLGVLAGEVLALRLNREFSCAGYFSDLGFDATRSCYGSFVVPGDVPRFAGLTVDQFLTVADEALGGNTAVLGPYGANIDHLWAAAARLNWLFSNCSGCGPIDGDGPLLTINDDSPDGEGPDPVSDALPKEFKIRSHPNPLHGSTTISLALPDDGEISVEIYDVQGRNVATLFRGSRTAGFHDFVWGGRDRQARPVGPGLYFCRISADGRPAIMQKLVKM